MFFDTCLSPAISFCKFGDVRVDAIEAGLDAVDAGSVRALRALHHVELALGLDLVAHQLQQQLPGGLRGFHRIDEVLRIAE